MAKHATAAYSKQQDGGMAVARNFRLREFASKDNTDTVLVADGLIELLQTIRDHFGAPVNINSAYRSDAHNKAIGGAAYSKHKYGLAADITVKGHSPYEVACYAETIIPRSGGIGLYKTFTHVDIRPTRTRWDQRSGKQVVVSHFTERVAH